VERNPHIQDFLDNLSKQSFGRTVGEAQQQKVCVCCGKPVTGFRDSISVSEYDITGYCQECQDEVFNDEEDEYYG